ncbi:ATP-dependent DNA helicase UvrD2 [Solwaraspora sp. WMMA2080]|uniref:ATP-dependent DNA helicase UvrD2 n=1 Tax=unclassified Solwaraspora TaxID=2627926 RepID=UPI00248C2B47|nr:MULTISPECIES: ATP-dependent DNA helicase UvrD2 [unclassified Solwaraspora]WBC00140.1 ATP-dependent DNA helicase UvrD2 [Solwaraspora sp. WMMA2059]WBC23796.1 ATP-dependent DNA helicase UvrD2 [Solwaraspora sp. WMMA2080]
MNSDPGPGRVLSGLDPEQRTAVTAPPVPVCILAGAGTGKTRAITSRIAYRVLSGEIAARHVLAVTFTARAAAEMRARLGALHVGGVQARTFHAAALRQVRYFAPRLLGGREMPELLDSKVRLVILAAGRVGVRTDRAAARDLAGEIEWAKSAMVEPSEYAVAAAKALRETPHEPAKVAEVYAGYEQIKRGNGVIDFEDVLRAAIWGIEEHPDVAEQVRAQYRHFVVDEYQDVNPLQQRLLDAWLGERDDLTVVGDASQTIYSFTGATSAYLVDFARRRREAVVVRLVRDYRSTPQVVGLANTVIRQAKGTEARLRLELVGQREPGPEPDVRIFTDEPAEAAAVAARCAELIAAGTPAAEIAVLFRTNAQSEAYEKALAEAAVPYVVQGAERFFERAEIRQAMVALRSAVRSTPGETPLVEAVTAGLAAVGWTPDQPPPGGAARERWEALAALVQLAEEFGAQPVLVPVGEAAVSERPVPLADFCAELQRRAAAQHVPTVAGVTLASLHSAKGLEWDAVFLVGLADGTLPTTYARTAEQLEEERRLLYVGVTRARQWLWLSYGAARSPGGRTRRPCRFLPQLDRSGGGAGGARRGGPGAGRSGERRRGQPVSCRVCGTTLLAGVDRKLGRCATCPSDLDEDLLDRLRAWRSRVSGDQRVPAYVVFTDATLLAIAERRPGSDAELLAIAGIGPRKLGLYGPSVHALVGGAAVDDLDWQKSSESDPENGLPPASQEA